MTAQFSEGLVYDGKSLGMQAEPLAPYLQALSDPPIFQDFTTACWRRYVGQWEVIDDRLYLVGIKAHWEDGSPVTLNQLFPGYPQRVFAHWYTGIARCGQGELLTYVHMGFASTYERDLLLSFERGVLKKTQVRDNTAENQTPHNTTSNSRHKRR